MHYEGYEAFKSFGGKCWLLALCQRGVLGDEKHLVFECPALQDLRDTNKNLFRAPHGDAMILLMWQDDIIDVARSIDMCLERGYTSAGPLMGYQASASEKCRPVLI